jgi:hypothetical protein
MRLGWRQHSSGQCRGIVCQALIYAADELPLGLESAQRPEADDEQCLEQSAAEYE